MVQATLITKINYIYQKLITNCRMNCEIELEHVQVELKYGRSQHFRHFIDQWFCYKWGYIKKRGKQPDWDSIAWQEYVTDDAMIVLEEVNTAKTKEEKKIAMRKVILKEHVIPMKEIIRVLKEFGKEISIEQIENMLNKYLIFATITKDEDRILTKAKLREKMPPSYYDPNHELHEDLFARYKETGIELYRR